MSAINQSAVDWLSSLPLELRTDIDASRAIVTQAITLFKVALGPEPLKLTAITLHFLLISQSPFEKVLDVLKDSPVACNWTPFKTSGRPQLRVKIIKATGWLVDAPSSTDSWECALCSAIMLSLLPVEIDYPGIWRQIFSVFESRTPPAQASEQPSMKQTPITQHSGNLLDTNSTHDGVDPTLRRELNLRLYPDTPGFIAKFFQPQQHAFATSAPLRDGENGWSTWPTTPEGKNVWPWFKMIMDTILPTDAKVAYYSSADAALTGSRATRKTDIVLYPTTATKKNPKGVRLNQGKYAWKEVLVVGELKPNTQKPGDLMIQLAGYVREIFYVQHDRRFVHAFTLAGDLLRTWIFHRGGAFGSYPVNINHDPHAFVDVFLGYATMSREQLGFDTTLVFESYQFKIGDQERVFRINRDVFFARKAIASRGTTCWDVRKKGDNSEYVLKDSWRSEKHASEIKILRKAQEMKVTGIVEVIDFEEVSYDGKLDDIRGNIMKGLKVGKPMHIRYRLVAGGSESASNSVSEVPPTPACSPLAPTPWLPSASPTLSKTRSGATTREGVAANVVKKSQGSSSKRKAVTRSEQFIKRPRRGSSQPNFTSQNPPEFNRIHTRILMRKGRDLVDFGSLQELLWGFHDAIEGHRSLVEADILHRDISIYNIMLSNPANPRSDGKRGFVIDLDLAIEISATKPSGAPHRTGTTEFMAIDVLRAQRHTFRHDLESFFYVFLWICVTHPLEEGRWNPLGRWATGDMLDVAEVKEKHMRRAVFDGYESVEESFGEWAKELIDVAESWRDVLFKLKSNGALTLETPENRDGMYDDIQMLLREGAARLEGK